MSMIKAVIFDVDGTLLDSFEANLNFFQEVLARAGYPETPTREQYTRMYHLNMRAVIEALLTAASVDEIERVYELGRSRTIEYPSDRVRLQEGVVETIKILSEKYLLGIATSRTRESIYNVSGLAALRHYFRETVAYEDTVEHKPDPAPLLLTARELGVEPHESVYIGDAATDLQAARAAGMKMILYSRYPAEGADASIYSFQELPQLVARL